MAESKNESETPARNTRSRGWSITVNNYTDEDIERFRYLKQIGEEVYCEKEVGTQGTHHLQGCVFFKSQRTFDQVKKIFPRAHIEPVKKKHAMINYCNKDGNSIFGPSRGHQMNVYLEELYKDVQWRPFQISILLLLDSKPDRRSVHWYWDEKGNTGKSFISRYIHWKYKAMICDGKADNIFHGFKNFIEDRDEFPEVCICDIPRTNEQYVSYRAFEKIKDGLFYSGKYEGGIVELLPLHLIVFANFPPNKTCMSEDRFVEHGLNPF